ncbi:MAG TPA: ECF RNA polymerase sigma factor SigK [Aeromicrobium sp.]|nr:ECF RNA polymerase sigma factor SigK [Aeromicrobium sp.]
MNEDHARLAGAPSSGGAPAGAGLADLLRSCSQGDDAAFARLYDETSPRAWGLALRVVRDRAQAEEVVQEAYLQIWRHAGRFDPSRGGAMAWLLTIVHRTAVDRVRSAEASSRREQAYEQRHQVIDHDSTAEAVHSSLEGHRVRAALSALTDLQRRAVELAYFGGYTHTEVAGLLDIPLGTAKTRIRDGLIRLRDTLEVTA